MKVGQAAKTSPMLPILSEEEELTWMSRLSRILIILTPASVNVKVVLIRTSRDVGALRHLIIVALICYFCCLSCVCALVKL